MDAEFLRAAGTAFGVIGGAGVLGLAVKIGISWNDLKRDVKETRVDCGEAAACASETRQTLTDDIYPRVQRMEQTLHGPDGNNGLYSDVRAIKAQLQETPGTPRRRRTDKKAKAA